MKLKRVATYRISSATPPCRLMRRYDLKGLEEEEEENEDEEEREWLLEPGQRSLPRALHADRLSYWSSRDFDENDDDVSADISVF